MDGGGVGVKEMTGGRGGSVVMIELIVPFIEVFFCCTFSSQTKHNKSI